MLSGVDPQATAGPRHLATGRPDDRAVSTRLAVETEARYDCYPCKRAAWADAHPPSPGSTGDWFSPAGTEEAMSEANVSTKQSQAGQATRLPSSYVDPSRAGDHQGSASEGPQAAVGLIWRVDRRDMFEKLRNGRRCRQGPLTLSWVPADVAEPPRVAYTIGRRVGSAVVRNRLRRRLRTLIRESASSLRPGVYLIGAGPAAVQLSYEDLRRTLLRVLTYIEDL